jgi:hypothetical protein
LEQRQVQIKWAEAAVAIKVATIIQRKEAAGRRFTSHIHQSLMELEVQVVQEPLQVTIQLTIHLLSLHQEAVLKPTTSPTTTT